MSRSLRRCALVAALVAAACGGPERRLDEAARLHRDRRPREALQVYREALAELGEGALSGELSALRVQALRRAADLAYLELGDYEAAVAYYRRLVVFAPGTADARAARGTIADIYRDRFKDPVGAIAQYAALAADGGPDAAAAQLRVARLYLDIGNAEQARTEARILTERWPASAEAAEALLVAAQAFGAEKRVDDAVRAYEAASRARPGTPLAAQALEAAANLLAEDARLDRALELYAAAIPGHPNPDAVRTSLEATRRRRDAKGTARPGDRAAALDHLSARPRRKEPTR